VLAKIVAITALALAAFVALGGRGASHDDANHVVANGMQRMQSLVDEDAHDVISSRLQDSTNAGKDFANNFDGFVK